MARVPRPFDVTVLGMGDDGHTASLFPHSPNLHAALDPSAAAGCVGMRAPTEPHARLSLNLAALLDSRQVYILILGDLDARCDASVRPHSRPGIRAGLHAGECELVGDAVGGIAVHIGARVMARAGADEVLVSSTVKDLVVGSGIKFKDRGAHRLKGVPRNGACTGSSSRRDERRSGPARRGKRYRARRIFLAHGRPDLEDGLAFASRERIRHRWKSRGLELESWARRWRAT